jgi:LacI family transcriptional regulator
MAKKVTLNDIAIATNLSKYAVSRSISGKAGISEQTRARVLQACKELGYSKLTPKDNSKYILMCIPQSDISDTTFWMKVLQGIESAASKKGFVLHVKVLKQYDDVLIINEIKKASGVLYAGYKSVEHARKHMKISRPSLLMTYPPDSLFEMDTIHTGDREASFALCKKLIEWGHTRIGFYGTTERPSSMNRFKGVEEAIKSYGLKLECNWNEEKYTDAACMLTELSDLKEKGKLPTAIMCSNESLAQSLVFMMSNLQMSVPDDISITGFNGDLNETLPIPLTSVGLNKFEYGASAFKSLFDRIENPDLAIKRTIILPELMLKGTAGPLQRKQSKNSHSTSLEML